MIYDLLWFPGKMWTSLNIHLPDSITFYPPGAHRLLMSLYQLHLQCFAPMLWAIQLLDLGTKHTKPFVFQVKHGETWWNMVKHGETWWNIPKNPKFWSSPIEPAKSRVPPPALSSCAVGRQLDFSAPEWVAEKIVLKSQLTLQNIDVSSV